MFNVEDLENTGESKVSHKPEIIMGNILAFLSLAHHCLIQHTYMYIFTEMLSNHSYCSVICFSIKICYKDFAMIINVLCKHHSNSCLIFLQAVLKHYFLYCENPSLLFACLLLFSFIVLSCLLFSFPSIPFLFINSLSLPSYPPPHKLLCSGNVIISATTDLILNKI